MTQQCHMLCIKPLFRAVFNYSYCYLSFRYMYGIGQGTGVLHGGPRTARGRGHFGFFAKISHWHNDRHLYSIRLRQFFHISVRQTYRLKALFLGFLSIYSDSRSIWGLRDISQKSNTNYDKNTASLQRCHGYDSHASLGVWNM